MRNYAGVVVVVASGVLAACGSDEPRIPDEPNDPLPGIFVRPSEFPHTNCGTGSLRDLILPSDYTRINDIALRIAPDGDDVVTFLDSGDVETAHVMTASDLLIRHEYTSHGIDGTAHIVEALDICGVDPDGTIHGSIGYCAVGFEDDCHTMFYDENIAPLLRIPGEAEGDHLSLVGELHGAAWPSYGTLDVKIDGDVAYLANGVDGLRLISIADPAHPVEVGHYASGTDYANDVAVTHAAGRTYAVLADDIGRVIDVTDPSQPAEVAELDVKPHTVTLDGTRAYFATGFDGYVPVYDLVDPRHPVKLGEWNAAQARPELRLFYHDLYVDNGIAYLSALTGQGLDVIDLTDPAVPVEIALQMESGDAYWHCPWVSTLGARKLAFDGDEATGRGLRIYDAGPTLADTVPLSTWKLRDDRVSIHNVMAFGNRVYMTHYEDGIRVLDISAPENPTQIAYFNTWVEGSSPGQYFAGALGLDVDLTRKRIYVADLSRGLMILQGDDTVFPN